MRLEGKPVIFAMCVGQLGSLLPHVVVPAILAGFLIPEWHLSGAQAGLLSGSGAAGYMLTVPVLATLTDRIDARKILIGGSALSAFGTALFGLFARICGPARCAMPSPGLVSPAPTCRCLRR